LDASWRILSVFRRQGEQHPVYAAAFIKEFPHLRKVQIKPREDYTAMPTRSKRFARNAVGGISLQIVPTEKPPLPIERSKKNGSEELRRSFTTA